MSDQKKSSRDNRANQLNPAHPAYHQARGNSLDDARQAAASSRPSPHVADGNTPPDTTAHDDLPGKPVASSSPGGRPSGSAR
jgi:hypothetical protein